MKAESKSGKQQNRCTAEVLSALKHCYGRHGFLLRQDTHNLTPETKAPPKYAYRSAKKKSIKAAATQISSCDAGIDKSEFIITTDWRCFPRESWPSPGRILHKFTFSDDCNAVKNTSPERFETPGQRPTAY